MHKEGGRSNRHFWVAFGFSCLAHGFILMPFFWRPQNSEALVQPRWIQATLARSVTQEIEKATSPVVTSVAPKEFQQPAKKNSALVKKTAEKKPHDVDRPVPSTKTPVVIAKPQAAPVNQVPEISLSGGRDPLMQVDIEFEVFMGPERQFSGLGRQQYVSDGAGHYGLSTSQTGPGEMEGADALWRIEISGDIVPQGLSPTFFELKGTLPERLISMKTAAMDSASSSARSGRIRDGILDRQSLLYQFAGNPPSPSGGKITLTDGAKYVEFFYRVDGSEILRVGALGDVRTVKLTLAVADGAEFIELWLIPERRYLPAKVRYSDEQGFVTEQSVVSLGYK